MNWNAAVLHWNWQSSSFLSVYVFPQSHCTASVVDTRIDAQNEKIPVRLWHHKYAVKNLPSDGLNHSLYSQTSETNLSEWTKNYSWSWNFVVVKLKREDLGWNDSFHRTLFVMDYVILVFDCADNLVVGLFPFFIVIHDAHPDHCPSSELLVVIRPYRLLLASIAAIRIYWLLLIDLSIYWSHRQSCVSCGYRVGQ